MRVTLQQEKAAVLALHVGGARADTEHCICRVLSNSRDSIKATHNVPSYYDSNCASLVCGGSEFFRSTCGRPGLRVTATCARTNVVPLRVKDRICFATRFQEVNMEDASQIELGTVIQAWHYGHQ